MRTAAYCTRGACRTEAPGAWPARSTTNTKCNMKRTHGAVKDVLKVATRAQLPTADTLQTLNAMVDDGARSCWHVAFDKWRKC